MKKLQGFRQDKEVSPVGSSPPKTADVRIVARTNQDPRQKIADGTFREDLYDRLNLLSLVVSPPEEKTRRHPGPGPAVHSQNLCRIGIPGMGMVRKVA